MSRIELKSYEFRREREGTWRELERLIGKAERGEPKLLCDTATANPELFEPLEDEAPSPAEKENRPPYAEEPPPGFEYDDDLSPDAYHREVAQQSCSKQHRRR